MESDFNNTNPVTVEYIKVRAASMVITRDIKGDIPATVILWPKFIT